MPARSLHLPALLALFTLAAPGLSAQAPDCGHGLWRLDAMDGAPVVAEITLDLSAPGRLAGQAPCNRYFADVAGDLPDFRPGPIAATRMACPDLATESGYLQALGTMTRAELTIGLSLRLTGPGNRSLTFLPAPAP